MEGAKEESRRHHIKGKKKDEVKGREKKERGNNKVIN